MEPKTAYLLLCFIGTIMPYLHLVTFLRNHGLDLGLFHAQMFSNDIASFFAWDVMASSFALWVLVAVEGRRAGMKHLWVPIVANFAVGVSLGLPLFLYLRERHLERAITLTR